MKTMEAMPTAANEKVNLNYKHTLIGMELDEPDLRMMGLLESLSKAFGIRRYSFLHAMPRLETTDPFAMVFTQAPLQLNEEKMSEVAMVLRNNVEKIIKPREDRKMEFYVAQGNALEEIVKLSEETYPDLVVIGRSDEERHVIKAKNVVRQINSDLLVLPEEAPTHIRKILVPIDFSENSIQALKKAMKLADALGNKEVFVINVYQRPNLMASRLEMSVEKFEEHIAANHKEGFDKFVKENIPEGKDRIHPILIQSDYPTVSKQILKQGKELGADLIVIGSRGHSKLARLLLGSTTEHLLDLNETIPTLIVREQSS